MVPPRIVLVSLLLVPACRRGGDVPDASSPPVDPNTGGGGAGAEVGKGDDPRRRRFAEAAERARVEAEKEKTRWTGDLVAQVQTLLAADYPDADTALAAALASPHRRPGHAERDRYRHPREVMRFFGLRRDMTVVEVGPGAGWWTELLAVVLYGKGKLVLPGFAVDDPDPGRAYRGLRDELLLSSAPVLYAEVERYVAPGGETAFGPPGSADMVIVFRMLHNWQRSGTFATNAEAAYEVLRPGGVLAVIQHRAPKGGDPDAWAEKGYLPEDYVVSALSKAGFELADRSEVNANPKDTKDHPEGVWTLPPTLRLGERDRDRYLAIGESDRMTLKFVKPGE